MRSLSISDFDKVSGGLMKPSTAQLGGVNRPSLLPPGGGGGSGGGGDNDTYEGTLGDLTDVGSHPGHDYITFGTNYENTEVTTNDRIVVGNQIGTNEYSVHLQELSNAPDIIGLHPDLKIGEWFDIAEGAFEVVVGGLGVAAGVTLGIATDGAAFLDPGVDDEILISSGTVVAGIGRIYMAAEGGGPSPPLE
ncbi:MAG: hypothetical protein ACREBW_00630 [Candidatus Micrarchaeaceae archaeon]